MKLTEKDIVLENINFKNCFIEIEKSIQSQLSKDQHPLRFVVTKTKGKTLNCELGLIDGCSNMSNMSKPESIFKFKKRQYENTKEFNVALLIPTGIGSEIGGHAGDATPVSNLVSEVCDNLITHPNVVNASDINEMSPNTLYVEGSILTKLLMGTISLQKTKNNRLLFVIDDHSDNLFVNAAINSLNAAQSSYGLDCVEIVKLNPSVKMKAVYSDSGRATGLVEDFSGLISLLSEYKGRYDALALSSVIKVPKNYHMDYFKSKGEMINPWGGVEALLTHATSLLYNIPSAHSPMFESQAIANMDPGVVDPRMAAEAVSLSFLQCIFKGLMKSPKIISNEELLNHSDLLSAKDISALVIPDGCVGLPTLAALAQGIPVIAVKDNDNIMDNDLRKLPWEEGQFIQVNSYLEAIGVLTAIKLGINLKSLKRPLDYCPVKTYNFLNQKKSKRY